MSVVILIIVILAVTVITSLTRNNDLSNIDLMADVQEDANGLRDELNEARIELRTVYTSAGEAAMEAYDLAAPRLSAANAAIDKLEGYDAQLSIIDLSAANSQLRSLMGELIPMVDQIHANDIVVQEDVKSCAMPQWR